MDGRVGRYELIDRLGVGGFATVWKAFDPSLDSEVAIKILADNWSADPEIRSRFIREAQLIRRIDDRRLVQVYDIGEDGDGRPFFVMRLAERGTLEDRLDGPLDAVAAHRLVDELAACLRCVHANGIVHRDVKPSNLMVEHGDGLIGSAAGFLAPDEYLVLGDFGLARDLAVGASQLTLAGGTSGFAAPEQYVPTGSPDARADLYAATAVLHFALTGVVPPHDGPSLEAFPTIAGDTKAVGAALRHGMARDPAGRPGDIDAWRAVMVDALDGAAQTRPDPGRDVSVPTVLDVPSVGDDDRSTGGRRAWAGVAVVSVVALALLAWLVLRGDGAGVDIAGPDRMVAGTAATFEVVDPVADRVYTWTDSQGGASSGVTHDATAIVPDSLVVEVEAIDPDGERTTGRRDVTVVAAPDGPVIEGPAEVAVGDSATYTVAAAESERVRWLDAEGATATSGASLVLEPTDAGDYLLRAVVTRADGSEIGSIRQVAFVD